MRNFVLSICALAFLNFRAEGSMINNEIDGISSTGEDTIDPVGDEKPPGGHPNVDLPTLDMIKREGYPAEAHVVTTSDGYILTIHRIPGVPGSIPVFLQHSLFGSSADWVIIEKSKALAYLLADRGYDVWLGNARGNTYSRAHTTLSTSDSKFWDFSWDEMGLYDLPAVISYITNYKSDNLIYIGHSMGTTIFYVMASMRPDIADKVRFMIALAPVAYVSHMRSPVRFIAPFSNNFECSNGFFIEQICIKSDFLNTILFLMKKGREWRPRKFVYHHRDDLMIKKRRSAFGPQAMLLEMIARFFGADEFLPQSEFLKFVAKFGCEFDISQLNVSHIFEMNICENFIFSFVGFDKDQFNITLLPVILSHTPAGTSTRTFVHFIQGVPSGRFRAYDYGTRKNRKYYNTITPPDYDLSKVRVPVALFVADNDWLASPTDVNRLWKQLPMKIGKYRVNFPKFNHIDFIWGIDAPKLVYQQVFSVIEKYSNNTRAITKTQPHYAESSWDPFKSELKKDINILHMDRSYELREPVKNANTSLLQFSENIFNAIALGAARKLIKVFSDSDFFPMYSGRNK